VTPICLGDDSVIVLVDSYGDRQSACCFQTNVLGTQADPQRRDDRHNAWRG
jgi:hypothetical protein